MLILDLKVIDVKFESPTMNIQAKQKNLTWANYLAVIGWVVYRSASTIKVVRYIEMCNEIKDTVRKVK